ncbi:isoprenoid biosynthesis glyoxalase ElbB [Gallaecimonas sp. GXIMD4217]|uniref:isoprenoid biosynthesis glyoxalase ElbB n=1 Tax=Gallaecimonas sp. GXIMD4217 TaxID=3131927 RepID=UPI00311AD767
MKRVAVILSGCGVFDGAEIHESVLTLLALEKAGAQYQCFAPNVEQMHVINHLSGEEMAERRNVLVEAARIARGNIKDVRELEVADFDALILPGGFGAAKNLCDFAVKGADCSVQPDVEAACRAFAEARKPAGYICISPAMIPRIYGPGARGTIGTDADTAQAFEAMGGEHLSCPVDEFRIDEQRKVVSTPAYMLAGSILEAQSGIDKLVAEVLRLA